MRPGIFHGQLPALENRHVKIYPDSILGISQGGGEDGPEARLTEIKPEAVTFISDCIRHGVSVSIMRYLSGLRIDKNKLRDKVTHFLQAQGFRFPEGKTYHSFVNTQSTVNHAAHLSNVGDNKRYALIVENILPNETQALLARTEENERISVCVVDQQHSLSDAFTQARAHLLMGADLRPARLYIDEKVESSPEPSPAGGGGSTPSNAV